jgi:hypothetical protein
MIPPIATANREKSAAQKSADTPPRKGLHMSKILSLAQVQATGRGSTARNGAVRRPSRRRWRQAPSPAVQPGQAPARANPAQGGAGTGRGPGACDDRGGHAVSPATATGLASEGRCKPCVHVAHTCTGRVARARATRRLRGAAAWRTPSEGHPETECSRASADRAGEGRWSHVQGVVLCSSILTAGGGASAAR